MDFPQYPLNLLSLANLLAGIVYLHGGKGMQSDPPGLDSDDVLVGGPGRDVLLGTLGDDLLKGGKGDDLLADSGGRNTMVGGPGDDIFLFAPDVSRPGAAFNRIKDFTPGEDVIGLAFDLPGVSPGSLGKAYFHKGKAAAEHDHHVVYDRKSGKIFFDADGAGGDAHFKVAKVDPGTKLHADDFMILPLG